VRKGEEAQGIFRIHTESLHCSWLIVTRYEGTAQINIDTENAEVVEAIEINGSRGVCVVKNRQTHIALANAEKNIYITLLATKKMPRDVVEKVARNIVIVSE